jgi:hypothetical protein
MRNYYFIASERVISLFNQLTPASPNEITQEVSGKVSAQDNRGIGAQVGLFGFGEVKADFSKGKGEELSHIERIHLTVELENKVQQIEKAIKFIDVETLQPKAGLEGLPVSFRGAYYAKGLKTNEFYRENPDTTQPYLYRKIKSMTIHIPYHWTHLISASALGNVRGRISIDGIGFTKKSDDESITITPLAFGLYINEQVADFYK